MVQPEKNTSNIVDTLGRLILNQLHELENIHGVEILLASENGSRSWGYASEQSDYDIKFIYRHKDISEYQKLQDAKQQVEHSSKCGLYNFEGWDIKKALLLMNKGNAQVQEFCLSPVSYMITNNGKEFIDFASKENEKLLSSFYYHYYGLAYRTFKERIKNVGEPTLKKYFYIIRPLLCVEYIYNEQKFPPLNLNTLLDYSLKNGLTNQEIYDTVNQLLNMKRDGEIPKTVKQRIEVLDKFLEDTLSYWNDKKPEKSENCNINDYNKIYKRFAFERI